MGLSLQGSLLYYKYILLLSHFRDSGVLMYRDTYLASVGEGKWFLTDIGCWILERGITSNIKYQISNNQNPISVKNHLPSPTTRNRK